MKHVTIGLTGFCVGAVAMALAIELFDGAKQQPAPQAPPSSVKAGAEKTADMPADARFAVVSGNGKVTVAVTNKKTITVVRDGKVAGTITGLRGKKPRMALNHDGSRLAAYDIRRFGILLWNTAENKEVAFYPTGDLNVTFRFSPGGTFLAFMSQGQEHLDLYNAGNGLHAVKLPGTYTFVAGGAAHTNRYALDSFAFADPEATTDDGLVVGLIPKDEPYGNAIQWQRGTSEWSHPQPSIVYAVPDMPWDKD